MAITVSKRAATQADAAFCVSAALLAGSKWDEDTVRSYLADDNFRIIIVSVRWPERNINTATPVAMIHLRRGNFEGDVRAKVEHLAIDPSRLPDIPTNVGARLRVADHLIAAIMAVPRRPGVTSAFATIPIGTKVEQYVNTLPLASNVVNGDGTRTVEFDIVAVTAALAAPSRALLYA